MLRTIGNLRVNRAGEITLILVSWCFYSLWQLTSNLSIHILTFSCTFLHRRHTNKWLYFTQSSKILHKIGPRVDEKTKKLKITLEAFKDAFNTWKNSWKKWWESSFYFVLFYQFSHPENSLYSIRKHILYMLMWQRYT